MVPENPGSPPHALTNGSGSENFLFLHVPDPALPVSPHLRGPTRATRCRQIPLSTLFIRKRESFNLENLRIGYLQQLLEVDEGLFVVNIDPVRSPAGSPDD